MCRWKDKPTDKIFYGDAMMHLKSGKQLGLHRYLYLDTQMRLLCHDLVRGNTNWRGKQQGKSLCSNSEKHFRISSNLPEMIRICISWCYIHHNWNFWFNECGTKLKKTCLGPDIGSSVVCVLTVSRHSPLRFDLPVSHLRTFFIPALFILLCQFLRSLIFILWNFGAGKNWIETFEVNWRHVWLNHFAWQWLKWGIT